MKKLGFICFSALSIQVGLPSPQTPIDFNYSFDGTNLYVLWNAYPGKSYTVQSTTNLPGTWSNAATIVAVTNSVATSFSTTGKAQFFRVVTLDLEGPEIYWTSPLAGGIAVSRQSAVQALLRDPSGINSNSIVLAIGTNPPVSLADSRLTLVTNVLTYVPRTNEFLGANGEFVSVKLSVADTLGNQTTNFTWSFRLEFSPVISSNIYFIGAGPPGCNLTLQSTNGDFFTYTYTGVSSCLSTGLHLVNTNLFTGYTRTVVGFVEYAASNTVVVLTRPTILAELLQSGSANSGGFTDLSAQPTRLRGTGPAYGLNLGIPLEYTVDLQRVLFSNSVIKIETLPGSQFNLTGELEVAGNFSGLHLTEFQASLNATADIRIEARGVASFSTNCAGNVVLIPEIRKGFGAVIGGIPVWLELGFKFEAGYSADFQGSAGITNGIQAVKEMLIREHWDETNGWTQFHEDPPLGWTRVGPTWQVQGSAKLRVYDRPTITLYAYKVAGVHVDFEPYVRFDSELQLNPPCFHATLSSGLDAHLGLDLSFWDKKWGALPSIPFELVPQDTIWQTNTCPGGPVITLQPQDQLVAPGDTVTFSVEAQGSGLIYQWRRNGLNLTDDGRITGTHKSTLRIANSVTNDAGKYDVRISDLSGATNSSVALLSFALCLGNEVIPAPNMAFIPCGSFVMGDSFGDRTNAGIAEVPVHTVFVSGFWMDRYEVTKALWDDVFVWATNHGYSFVGNEQGKAPNHPVVNVDGGDAARWCNARSEKEGRVPAYYRDTAMTVALRTVDGSVPDQNAVKWNAGYRVPTEAEWEKAARGGLKGRRFPWGDTISHAQANYYGQMQTYPQLHFAFPYDFGEYGYHPAYRDSSNLGTTSPVGSFAPNRYGLYDMAGNTDEWCWPVGYYDNGIQFDPRGTVGASLRGGTLYCNADMCRTASRQTCGLRGLRTILPLSREVAPTITSQPVSRTNWAGSSATFSVLVSGSPGFVYQWRKNGNVLSNGGNIWGAGNPTLLDSEVQIGDAGAYDVIVSNWSGVVTSQVATLTVLSQPALIDFETSIPPQISGSGTRTPVQGYAGIGTFAGQFLRNTSAGQSTVLTLNNLPQHTRISLAFLLATIDSWDGTSPDYGPDHFQVYVDGVKVFDESIGWYAPSFVPDVGVLLSQGSNLGFNSFDDAAFNMGLQHQFQNIPHTASSLTVTFQAAGAGYTGGDDESFGLDNIQVTLQGPP